MPHPESIQINADAAEIHPDPARVANQNWEQIKETPDADVASAGGPRGVVH